MDVKFLDGLVTVRFLKTESERNFGFPHIPTQKRDLWLVWIAGLWKEMTVKAQQDMQAYFSFKLLS